MEMEIICISSDDESSSQKENKTNKSVANVKESKNSSKVEILSSDDEKVEKNNRKRKISQIKREDIIYIVEKKKKLDTNQDTRLKITEITPDSTPKSNFISAVCKVYPVAECDTTNKDEEVIIERLNLVVKGKKKISYITHDMFPVFISFCLQIARADEKKDMEKIVNKLKRYYDHLDPIYASSQRFALFLNEKREAIMNNDQQKYMHITDVRNEMKKNSKKNFNSSEYDAVPSTSYAANNLNSNNTIDSDYEDDTASPKVKRKTKQILHAMKKCEAAIKKLEEAEVDFNEENDSSYIKVEKYKQRMVELYNKYCELTGDNTDAGRAYLRPKHWSPTGIVVVDHAITNFINSKITQRNKTKKIEALTNDLIFPDYRDILECVIRCNNTKNLGLDKRKQKQLAKKAFQELGEHLQRSRKNDYWDTFSLYLENAEEDPATKDQTLKQKLDINRTEGNRRLTAIFEKYVIQQEQIKEQDNVDKIALEEEEREEEEEEEEEDDDDDDDNDNEEEEEDEEEEDNDNEEEEEGIVNNKDKSQNNLLVINLSDEDNENVDKTTEDINKTIKENKSSSEENKNNINIVNQDIDISSKTIADKSPEQCNEKVKIVSAKENDTISENEISNKAIVDKPPEQCNEKVKIISAKENDAVSKNEISNKANKSSGQCNEKIKIVSAKENNAVSKNEISNKAIADKSQEQCKKIKIVPAKENDAVSKNEKLSEVHKLCTDNNAMDPKIQKSLLPTSMANCTSNVDRIEENLTEPAIQGAPKEITNSMKETVTMGRADTTTTNVTSTSKDAELITGNGPDIMSDGKDNEIDNEIEIIGNTTDAMKVPSGNQSEEEKKPLLRVRSFAKPPTTWKDNQQNAKKTVRENVPKTMNQKEVIDLTDEIVTKPLTTNKELKVKKSPIIAKCAIKVGDKLIPVIKKKTLIIPSKNLITVHNITNVQNITKNYLKVDKGTGQLISSVNKVPGPKIIRLPSVQVNANQQRKTSMIFGRQEVPLKGNETIIQVVPPGKQILLPKKKTVQVTLSQQNECSQATKPK